MGATANPLDASSADRDKLLSDDGNSMPFEQALAELAQIVMALEQGELPLAESLEQYERGIRHLRQCYRQLEQAERRVELLTAINADGESVTEPFDEQAMSLEEKANRRDVRRSAPGGQRRSAGELRGDE
jgi:exodeoxyribonuclease VII small subunit